MVGRDWEGSAGPKGPEKDPLDGTQFRGMGVGGGVRPIDARAMTPTIINCRSMYLI